MAYDQGRAGGTAAGANVTTFSLIFGAAQGRNGGFGKPPQNYICNVIDVMWELASAGASTIAVTDSAGNTYAQVSAITAGTENWSSWVCVGASLAPNLLTFNTVTVTCNTTMAQVSMAIHEYSNIVGIETWDFENARLSAPLVCSVTTTHSIDTLHTFCASSFALSIPAPYASGPAFVQRETAPAAASILLTSFDAPVSTPGTFTAQYGTYSVALKPAVYGALLALINYVNPLTPTGAWLQILEPAPAGLTNRTAYLFSGDGQSNHEWTNTLNQRGTAQIPLILLPGDTYDPTTVEGCQVYIYDQTAGLFSYSPPVGTLVWAGTIEKVTIEWEGGDGVRKATLDCVSFHQCFDALLVPPQLFQYTSAGAIFTQLYNTVANGVPLTIGTVTGGSGTGANFVINNLNLNWNRLSEVFNQIALAANCVWGIDLPTLTVYFKPPTTTASGKMAPIAVRR